MHRIGLEYVDGSDLNYIASYDVPDNVPLTTIATLSRIYHNMFMSDDDVLLDQVYSLNFEEWILDVAGVVIIPVNEGTVYDAYTGKPW